MRAWRRMSGATLPAWRRRARARPASVADGFTLPELLIASVISVVALGAVALSLAINQRSAVMARRQMQAMHEARARMEELTSQQFDLLPPAQVQRDGWRYTVVVVEPNRTKDITVEVDWIVPWSGRQRTVTLTTSMSRSLHY